ncbi:MAG: 4Fe-4S binding protein [Planctomycetota bacterium]
MSRPLPIAYAYDEEALGFGAPQGTPEAPSAGGEAGPLGYAALAAIALGVLSFAAQLGGAPYAGTWVGFLSGLPLAALGAAAFFWASYRGTTPGIKHDGVFFGSMTGRGVLAWFTALGLTAFYVVLYWIPDPSAIAKRSPGESFPERAWAWTLGWTSALFERAIDTVDPLARALGVGHADKWFLYGFLYTLAVLTFGGRMLMKYRHSRYQQVRTLSVMGFQLGLAFLLPQLLKAARQPEFYFTYFWPLKPEYLFPGSLSGLYAKGGLPMFMAFWTVAASFVAVPVLTYFFGKRWYCSWVCGCGALAETLADPYRQHMPTSKGAWRLERWLIHSVLVTIVVLTVALWLTRGSKAPWVGSFRAWYGFLIGAAFAGVIGVGFYPLLGGRAWCRFGCPQAAILGLFQRFFSRFRITTNGGQCISCGNCSTYCEMGIDVRAYAQQGENVVRASCVGCGVCAEVCPRGVLKLENGPTFKDRYPGAENPARSFLSALTEGPTIP